LVHKGDYFMSKFLALAILAALPALPQAAQKAAKSAQAKQAQQTPSAEQFKQRVPRGVKWMPDLAYREGNPAWRADLAMPEAAPAKPRPGVVIIHGGGWTSGDKRGGFWGELPLDYAQKGYVAISINYRFVTETPMPACIEDVKCAVRWFRAHAAEFKLDPQRIGAFGYSAGAHLVAMLALAGPDAGLEGDGPYRDQSSAVQAACAGGTPTDFVNWGSSGTPVEARFSRLFGGPENTANERARRSSPITYARADAPPLLFMQGANDRTVPRSQVESLVKALRDAGAKNTTLIFFDDAGHEMFNRFAPITNGAMMGFFDSTIGKEK
jgi:acetyl esterase/lipase